MEIFAAFVAFRKRNGLRELLFLRARDTYYYTLPGDKQLLGESIEDSLYRGLSTHGINPTDMQHIGTVNGHTSDGRVQVLHLYSGNLGESLETNNEVAWMDKSRFYASNPFMTSSMVSVTVPYLEKQGHW